jgi:hypothetical protein
MSVGKGGAALLDGLDGTGGVIIGGDGAITGGGGGATAIGADAGAGAGGDPLVEAASWDGAVAQPASAKTPTHTIKAVLDIILFAPH